MRDADPVFPYDITDVEAAAGFALRPLTPNGPASPVAVVRVFGSALLAVKLRRADGDIEYAVWDHTNVPL